MRDYEKVADLAEGPQTVVRDTLGLLCGKKLGFGCYREVFELPWMPAFVLKLETDAGSFHNVLEWEVWREIKDSKWSGYFAPCEAISATGAALLMRRTRPIKAFPEGLTLPSFFQDVKPDNFGLLKGRIVCHDYSISELIRSNLRGTKVKPVSTHIGRDRRDIVAAVGDALKEG